MQALSEGRLPEIDAEIDERVGEIAENVETILEAHQIGQG